MVHCLGSQGLTNLVDHAADCCGQCKRCGDRIFPVQPALLGLTRCTLSLVEAADADIVPRPQHAGVQRLDLVRRPRPLPGGAVPVLLVRPGPRRPASSHAAHALRRPPPRCMLLAERASSPHCVSQAEDPNHRQGAVAHHEGTQLQGPLDERMAAYLL